MATVAKRAKKTVLNCMLAGFLCCCGWVEKESVVLLIERESGKGRPATKKANLLCTEEELMREG